MLVLALVLFTVSVLMCGIALWIVKKSKSIGFDFSSRDLAGEVRKMTNTLPRVARPRAARPGRQPAPHLRPAARPLGAVVSRISLGKP